jgi:hypothetical protein
MATTIGHPVGLLRYSLQHGTVAARVSKVIPFATKFTKEGLKSFTD